MTSTDISYVASGFYEDCSRLIEKFKENESIRFDAFCKAWREMKFSLVFLYHKTYADMLEFCEEVLSIAKSFLLSSTDLINQIGGLYLLYGLYYKMPISKVKIRVTLKDWKSFLNLHQQIKRAKLHDASYIFVKLVIDNAYHYTLFSSEYVLGKSYRAQDHMVDNPYSILNDIVDEVDNGDLSRIQTLSRVYDAQKTKLLTNVTSNQKLQLFDKNFVDDIINQIETLQEKRQPQTGTKKKLKLQPSDSRAEKKKYIDDKIRPKIGHGFDTDSSDDDTSDMELVSNDVVKSLPKSFDQTDDEDMSSEKDEPKSEDQENYDTKKEHVSSDDEEVSSG
ncbi:hypothetical protein QAD02_022243 [Eretmocerus hayati]|uniref:Uncharacterized protein n=1 Tax=Eretmocerus hayati TaxID=131215 RepID=A0ACC2PUY5_9HYME|nr:hypothetical protein QAD02_022243 [Eretmocerus hayati]